MQHKLKEGNVYAYNLPQNTANYQVRIALCPKGLWVCILESVMQWKLTITEQMIKQIVAKASGAKQVFAFREFVDAVINGLQKDHQRWSIGIMTPIELDMLRGGSGKSHSGNKIYLILSDKETKHHYPFTFPMNDLCEKEKYIQAIKSMKVEFENLKGNPDKSQNSFSVMSETNIMNQQLIAENQELKKKIRIYEESLTQKRGAVEIDEILKEKNNLEIKAETKKREQNKQIIRLKNIHHLLERQNNQIRNEVDAIQKQLQLLQDNVSNPAKLKSHALRVLKGYETELRTGKKVMMKQGKQIDNLKRNINNSKNNERRVLGKIKQIQTEIEQARKKANVKEISNRLYSHSGGSRQASSVASSSKVPSVASNSSDGRGPRSVGSNRTGPNNLVRQNLLKKTSDVRDRKNSNQNKNLLKTTPNIKTPAPLRKTEYKPPVRPVVSSHQVKNEQKPPAYNRTYNKVQRSDSGSFKSVSAEHKKNTFSPADRERQQKAMQRLTGNRLKTNSNPKQAITTTKSTSNVNRTTQQRGTLNSGKKQNPKDILNRMKQIKAQYNNRSKNLASKNQDLTAKVAQLTNKK